MLEPNTVVYPPNKILEAKLDLSTTPVIYNHLLFIDINKKGETLIGSSNISGTLWEGTSLYFTSTENVQNFQFDKSYIGSTVSDGKFLDEKTIILGEDTGILNIVTITENNLISNGFFKESDRIAKISTWDRSSRVLTCSGNSVCIWDVNATSNQPTHHFTNFHTQTVNYVDALKSYENIFASASTDRKCCLWDTRDPHPAQVVYANDFCALTSVACHQTNNNYLAVGTESGTIYLIDKRQPKDFVAEIDCNCCVYRMVFNDSNKLAVCGDTNKVFVFEEQQENFKEIYCNDEHRGIVRGLAWYNDTLFSCGFDKQVVKHLL